MTSTVSIVAVAAAGFAGCCALVAPRGPIAWVTTRRARPHTAAFLAERSATANRIAASIAAGEADARNATDRLALAAGCARALQHLAPPPVLDRWTLAVERIHSHPQRLSHNDPLRLAACLEYCTDLAYEELARAGRGREAADRASAPMGTFLMAGVLQRIDGWDILHDHRNAGIYELANPNSSEKPRCPFCKWGDYDQTRLGCDECGPTGGLDRVFPAMPLPRRAGPDTVAESRRARAIETRDLARMEARI